MLIEHTPTHILQVDIFTSLDKTDEQKKEKKSQIYHDKSSESNQT